MTDARFDLLILDFDGTLVDSAAGITACFDAALAAFGPEPPPLDSVRPRIGLTLEECIRQLRDGRDFPGTMAASSGVCGF